MPIATASEIASRAASAPSDVPTSDEIYYRASELMEAGVVESISEGTTYLKILEDDRRGVALPPETKRYLEKAREIEARTRELHELRQSALSRADRIRLLDSRRASLRQRLANEQAEAAKFHDEKKALSLCAQDYISRWPFSGAPLDARSEGFVQTLNALKFKAFIDEYVIPELTRQLADLESELNQLLSAESSA